MKKELTNFAFIDSQNLHLGIRDLGWKLNWREFRTHLAEKYAVGKAYLFIGYLPENQNLYRMLQLAGYVLIFKPILTGERGVVKGNVDADLVLQTMVDYETYERAVIVSSDGDFYSLVAYLKSQEKLERVVSASRAKCSRLLKQAAGERISFLEYARRKLEYKNEEALPQGET